MTGMITDAVCLFLLRRIFIDNIGIVFVSTIKIGIVPSARNPQWKVVFFPPYLKLSPTMELRARKVTQGQHLDLAARGTRSLQVQA